MTTLLLDVRFALRMLWKHKAFTASALATIGLAIGANTAIFTLVSSVLLQPLPLPRPERIVRVEERHAAASQLDGREFRGPESQVPVACQRRRLPPELPGSERG